MINTSLLHSEDHSAPGRRQVEQGLARAMRNLGAVPERVTEQFLADEVSSRELLQLAWDHAEQEIEELQTELRVIRQRHQEAERQLLARINQRKRLQQTILESAGEPTTGA